MSDLVAARQPQASRRRLVERGAVSAEYALLTVGTITLGGIILKLLSDAGLRDQLLQIIFGLIKLILSHFGVLL